MRTFLIVLAVAMVLLAARSFDRPAVGLNEPQSASPTFEPPATDRCAGMPEDALSPNPPVRDEEACATPTLELLPVTAQAR